MVTIFYGACSILTTCLAYSFLAGYFEVIEELADLLPGYPIESLKKVVDGFILLILVLMVLSYIGLIYTW
mgnify:FL=1